MAFQLGHGAASVLWLSILSALSEQAEVSLLLLDRGNCPKLPGAQAIAFPTFTLGAAAADSFLIEEICKEQGVDAFMSTCHTTPIATPSILVLHDEFSDELWPSFPVRARQERELAIGHASLVLCSRGSPADEALRAQVSQPTPFQTPQEAAEILPGLLRRVACERESGAAREFFRDWERLCLGVQF